MQEKELVEYFLVERVAYQLTLILFQENFDKGNVIKVPSLGIVIQREKEEVEDGYSAPLRNPR